MPNPRHALALAGLVLFGAALVPVGCSPGDPMPCYGGPVPNGALLWDCTITRCSFGCEVGEGFVETVAAPTYGLARSCLLDLLAQSGDATVLYRVECIFAGTWDQGSPGGAPNAVDLETGEPT